MVLPVHVSGLSSRRTVVKGIAGAGLIAVGGSGLLTAACSRDGTVLAGQGDLPVRVISTEGTQVVTIQQLMNNKGLYKESGVVPSLLTVASGTTIVGSLLNDQSDICIFAGFSALLSAIAQGTDLRILGAASVGGQYALLAMNPAIQQVQDLEGRTIGVGQVGAQLHHATLALLMKKGVDVGKVRFVNIGTSAAVFRAVAAGVVDAGPGQASCASMKAIREKREVLVRTLAAYCKAFRYVQRDPGSRNDFVQAQLDALGQKNREQVIAGATSQWEYLQKRRPYAEDLSRSRDRLQYMQQLNMRIAGQKDMIPYEQLIDTSLAREAVARLA